MSRSTQRLNRGMWGTKTTLFFLALATAALAALSAFAVSVSVDTPAAKAQTATPTWMLQTTEGNLPDGQFKSVVGLSQGEYEVIEHGDPQTGDVVKIPGRKNVSNIVLSRPLSGVPDLAAWHQLVNDQDPTAGHTDGSIERLDGTGKPIAVFNFTDAWPADYRLVQGGGKVSEEIELVVESVKRDGT